VYTVQFLTGSALLQYCRCDFADRKKQQQQQQ